jgi:uncharacterized protein (TIGR00159 family)
MRSLFFEIGVADLADIAVVALLLYATLAWLHRTRATFAVLGLVILGGIYVAAREVGLQLTAWLFQGFFAVFVILIVVIFQEELKQLFERLAVLSLRRGRETAIASRTIDTLAGCLADFARDRIGALIVLPGRDPVERHIRGGIELDGKISEPLLRSLFDPHSPGHDGAVLLAGDRIVRFAAHLPLSKNVEQLGRLGTRHSAALGLAETTDALCLVVSEERGTISAASDGRLRALTGPQEAAYVVEEFLRSRQPLPERYRTWTEALLHQWPLKGAAAAIALALWLLFVPGSKISRATWVLPVTVENLPSEYTLQSVQPAEVEVTLSGVRRAFYLFDSRRLQVVIDGSLAALGRRTFRITEENLRLPREIVLEQVRPPTVRIVVERQTPGEPKTQLQSKAGA